MKKLISGFAILCCLILPAGVLAASGFSDPLLIDGLQMDEDGIDVGPSDPRICTGSNDAIFVTWVDEDETGATGIYFTRSLDGGKSFEEKQRIDYSGATDGDDVILSDPEIDIDSEGTICIMYSKRDTEADETFSLILRKSEDDGGSFDSQTVYSDNHYFPAASEGLKITDRGIYYLWSTIGGIYLARMEGDNDIDVIELLREGEAPGSSISARSMAWPSFTIDSDNNIYVLWFEAILDIEESYIPLHDLYFAKLENGQDHFSGIKRVAKCDSWAGALTKPSIMKTSTDTLVIAWNDGASSIEDAFGGVPQPLYSALSDDGGATFSDPLEVSCGETGYIRQLSMTIDQNDAIHFLYQLSGNGSLNYGKSSDRFNSFDPILRIDDMVYLSDMCLNEKEDTVYAVWHYQGNSTNPSAKEGIYFSKSGEGAPDVVDAGSGGGGGSGGCFIQGLLD